MKRFINILYKVVGGQYKSSIGEVDIQEEWQGWDAWVSIESTFKR